MLKTKNLVSGVKEVPYTWIFEHYCNLPEKLGGQDLKITSLWKNERTPSMCIYFDRTANKYKFKDFSTDRQGDAYTLVKELKNCDFYQAAHDIVDNYNEFVLHNNGGYDIQEFKKQSKYRVVDTVVRGWTTADQYFWTKFNIGSRLLEQHCVKPLESYTMSKEEDGDVKTLEISGRNIYGYFKANGELYKIYQPKVQDKKFIKVKDYVQGSEQLKGHDYLVIASSLKDLMSLKSLNLKVDVIAPDSENSMIKKEMMEELKSRYKTVITLFDNDEAGIKAMNKYEEQYQIPFIHLRMSKDLADSVRDFGSRETTVKLVPLLNRRIVTEDHAQD
jgi:5S rRNA maturation endonuclease (ribonuclease M5)